MRTVEWEEVTFYQPVTPITVLHGPMWQAECLTCHWMGDAVDSQTDALEQRADHRCQPVSARQRDRIGEHGIAP